MRLVFTSCAALVVLAVQPGCFKAEDFVTLPFANDVGNGVPTILGLGTGEACDPVAAPAECRDGLSCTDGACQPDGSLLIGEGCVMTAECQKNSFCGPSIACAVPDENGLPDYEPKSSCVTDQECKDLIGDDKAFCIPRLQQVCQKAGDAAEGGSCTLDSN